MNRVQIACLHAGVALVTLTGAVFAWMKYLMKSSDPFSVVNHPWQPYMLAAHVVVSPLLLFLLGWTFGNHMWPKLVYGAPKRASGLWSLALIAPMVLSAYFLQVATADATRWGMAVAHWITSAAFVIGYGIHVARRPTTQDRRISESIPEGAQSTVVIARESSPVPARPPRQKSAPRRRGR